MEIKEFTVGPLLGEGTYSKIFKVRRKTDRKKLVLKKMSTNSDSIKKAISQEIALQGLLGNSENFVKLFGHFIEQNGFICLVFEYCRERDLQLLINKATLKKELVQDEFVYNVVRGLSNALAYLEEREILHLNVKPSSIFLDSDFHPKLGDFSFAHYAAMPPSRMSKVTPYSAPEIVLAQPVGYKTDVWSVGCVAYALHQLNPPFEGTSDDLRKNICGRNIRVATTRDNCQALFDFLGPMLATNSFFRPTFQEIAQHPILQQVPNRTSPFLPQEEITSAISKINIHVSSTDSSEGAQATAAKLNPYFVSRPRNFPMPPRKVRFLNDGTKEVSYKWYEIEPKQKIESVKASSSKPEGLPFLNEIHNFEFKKRPVKPEARGNYSKEELERAVAEKLATRKFTMKYLRKTGKENFIVKHTKL